MTPGGRRSLVLGLVGCLSLALALAGCTHDGAPVAEPPSRSNQPIATPTPTSSPSPPESPTGSPLSSHEPTPPQFRNPLPGMPPVLDGDVYAATGPGMVLPRIADEPGYLYVPNSYGAPYTTVIDQRTRKV